MYSTKKRKKYEKKQVLSSILVQVFIVHDALTSLLLVGFLFPFFFFVFVLGEICVIGINRTDPVLFFFLICVGKIGEAYARYVGSANSLTIELSSMESKLMTVTWKKTVVGFPVSTRKKKSFNLNFI